MKLSRITSLILEGVLLILRLGGLIAIPVHPVIYYEENAVDTRVASSLASRLMFTWAQHILRTAHTNKRLELTDLPALRYCMRAATLEKTFTERAGLSGLQDAIISSFRQSLLLQTTLAIVMHALALLPQLAMLNLLGLVESKRDGIVTVADAYPWAFGLILATFIQVVLKNWLAYKTHLDIAIPVESLLAALIFKKTMVRETINDNVLLEEDAERTRTTEQVDNRHISYQAIVDLVGVDVTTCSEVAASLTMYPASLVGLISSIALLVFILGWLPLIAGLTVFGMSIPFNVYLSRFYATANTDLKMARNTRLAVFNETLMGIMHLKLGGVVDRWEQKIIQERKRELDALSRVYALDLGLVACWIFGPTGFSAMSLITFAMLQGSLSPSVAFTTLSVLNQIDHFLSILPEFANRTIQASSALARIERYLTSSEVQDCSEYSDTIEFRSVSVCWPSASQDENGFNLANLNLKFPKGDLSVVCGKQGVGKTLLLNAIIGNARKLSGRISRPHGPPPQERSDRFANKTTWIVDGKMAYVSQISWMEKSTLQQNIVFGLPYDQGRYRSVLQACRLEADVDFIAGGDSTEVGAKGLMLGASQQCKVSLARALYSRASILLIDGKGPGMCL